MMPSRGVAPATIAPRELVVLGVSAFLLTASAGLVDAWTFVTHGGVLATTQSGNIVIMMVAFAQGHRAAALGHIPSLVAFVTGMAVSRASIAWPRSRAVATRAARLGLVALGLGALSAAAPAMRDGHVTAALGLLAGIQITSLSRIGDWGFNTGMTTGNLRGAVTSIVAALAGDRGQRVRAGVMAAICAAFAGGAFTGTRVAPALGSATLTVGAVLVAAAALFCRTLPAGQAT